LRIFPVLPVLLPELLLPVPELPPLLLPEVLLPEPMPPPLMPALPPVAGLPPPAVFTGSFSAAKRVDVVAPSVVVPPL
jgi:hypothetical protein